MVNSSLAYEILLYLNSFYFGLWGGCEIGMGVLKAINVQYTSYQLQNFGICLVVILVAEAVRVYLGRKGALNEHGWPVIISVVLTIPCAFGTWYLLKMQHKTLKLETLLCALMFSLQLTEIGYVIIFIFSKCRPKTHTIDTHSKYVHLSFASCTMLFIIYEIFLLYIKTKHLLPPPT